MRQIKYINNDPNGSGIEMFDKNKKKFKNEWNWLGYFAQNFEPSISFITKMDNALKEIFRAKIGVELDWSKIFLMITPIDNQLYLEYDADTFQNKYTLICSLRHDEKFINYYGEVLWWDFDHFKEFDYREDVSDLNILFDWIPSEFNEPLILQDLPASVKNGNKPVLRRLKYKVKFPVFSKYNSMPHEGKFAITLIDNADKEKVSYTLEGARAKWNTQTDQARQTEDSTLERGYCHTVSFDGVEDNIAYWYIDAGSAHEGIHEFLLKELSDSGIMIKSVEIQML